MAYLRIDDFGSDVLPVGCCGEILDNLDHSRCIVGREDASVRPARGSHPRHHAGAARHIKNVLGLVLGHGAKQLVRNRLDEPRRNGFVVAGVVGPRLRVTNSRHLEAGEGRERETRERHR